MSVIMKQLTIILLGLIGVAYGQSNPTSAKVRYVNGLYVGTKLDSYFAAADSNAIYWRADSVVMAKYKGTARALAFSGDLAPYKLIADTFFTNGYTTRARLKQYGDSLSNAVANGFVTIGTSQTVTGDKTFSNDIFVNGLRFGRSGESSSVLISNLTTIGSGSVAIGQDASAISPFSVSIGREAESGNSSGNDNVSLGYQSGTNLTAATSNVIIGSQAGVSFGAIASPLTTPTNSIFIGANSRALTNGNTNEIVIGRSAIGNGSNTVTIGNSSVTDNYFSGVLRATRGIFSSTPTLINTTTHNGIDTLQVNGSMFGTRGRFNNGFSSQIEAWGWNNIQGASTNAGEIRFGGTTSIQGRIIYASAGNTTMYIDNTFDDANAEIKFRTRVAGTAVTPLTLTSTAATFTTTLTASSLIKSGGTSTQSLMADGSVQTVTSGTYTPTLTNTTNISTSVLTSARYTRVGDIVTVYIKASAVVSSAASTELTFTLPIATSSTSYVLLGTADGNGRVAVSSGSSSNTTIGAQWTAPSATTAIVEISFQYIVN